MSGEAYHFRTETVNSKDLTNLCEKCGSALYHEKTPTAVHLVDAPEAISSAVKGKFFHDHLDLSAWARQQALEEEKAAQVILPHLPGSHDIRAKRVKAYEALAIWAKDPSRPSSARHG